MEKNVTDTSKKKKANHYIDNEEFFHAMCAWKELVIEAENVGESRPAITDYIGDCFLKIAEHLAYKPNFMNYNYRDDMIGDGIENCLVYAHNFDPNKSKNPFSYFTQIIYYAFLRRIEKEKKQAYIKYKALKMNDVNGLFSKYYKENYFEDETANEEAALRGMFNLSDKDVDKFTPAKKKKKKKKKKPTDSSGSLEDIIDNEDSTSE